MFDIFGKNKSHIPASATFNITEVGRNRVDTNYRGDDKDRILMALDTFGTSNTREISKNAKLNKGRIERLVPILISGGYMQPVRGDTSE